MTSGGMPAEADMKRRISAVLALLKPRPGDVSDPPWGDGETEICGLTVAGPGLSLLRKPHDGSVMISASHAAHVSPRRCPERQRGGNRAATHRYQVGRVKRCTIRLATG